MSRPEVGGFEPPEQCCLLLGELPQKARVDGHDYAVNWGFRHSLLFEGLMLDAGVPPVLKLQQALSLYYPVMPANAEAALEGALWFWRCGRQRPEAGTAAGGGKKPRLFDFEQDAPYLYAAFMRDYGIDLTAESGLHWWKFCALLEGLDRDNLFCRILEYRGADLEGMNGEQRRFYTEMQRRYALAPGAAEAEALDAIEAALRGDGDLERLLGRDKG